MHIAGVRVQGCGLPADRLNDPWMTMPHMRDIVVAIQIFLA